MQYQDERAHLVVFNICLAGGR